MEDGREDVEVCGRKEEEEGAGERSRKREAKKKKADLATVTEPDGQGRLGLTCSCNDAPVICPARAIIFMQSIICLFVGWPSL